MRKCVLCGKETKGSIGAAGIKWTMICQPCKDIEDNNLKKQIHSQDIMFNKLLPAIGGSK
jgi:hypothetical protein